MTDPVYLPLKGSTKQPGVRGWADPGYAGVEPKGRVGRRADGLVIVDCDSDDAASLWHDITGNAPATFTVSTPRGMHFYYEAGPDAPTGPAVGVLPGVDIRAGSGSYVVCPPTPGYEVVGRRRKMASFDARWLPTSTAVLDAALHDDWEVIPDGRRNATLAAFAGAFRRQGMDMAVIYQLLQGINEGLCDPPLPHDELEIIARSVGRYEPDPVFELEIEGDKPSEETLEKADTDGDLWSWLSDMRMPPAPEWWWKPYLPKGRLVLLDGSEGIGKGLFAVHLAMRVATEAPVLWMSTEDDPEEDIQRRLKAAGWSPKGYHDIGFATVDPKFPTHTDVIEREITDQGAGLVVMDPGRSFLAPPDGSKGMSYNDEAHIRPGLEAINRMSKRTGCTVIFVHHWNKDTQASVSKRAGGSGAFAQVVRHRVTLAWHGPTEGGVGAFEVSKSNIAPKGGVYGYAVEAAPKLDTATFQLTDELSQYADLGAWMKAVEGGIEIDRSEEAFEAMRSLPPGAPVGPVTELVRQYGLPAGEAKDLLDDLVDTGVLRRGPKNKLFRVGDGERAG